jgi:hypothetical protein
MPNAPYLVLPEVSSERRQFIPFGFEQPSTLCSNLVKIAPEATLFHFGILSSTMHNAWMRAVAGRLESRYRYSAAIVYNNFPWPFCATAQANTENSAQKVPPALAGKASAAITTATNTAIESAAQAVLDARAQFPTSSLADLYDPLTMPPTLLKAHQKLDAAVDKAYEACGGPKTYKNDAERVAFLFELYQRQTSFLAVGATRKRTRQKAL